MVIYSMLLTDFDRTDGNFPMTSIHVPGVGIKQQ